MIKILIAEDNRNVRCQIRKLLEKTPDLKVVGEAENGQQALRLLDLCDVDVLLLDIEMPEMGGLQVLEALKGTNKRLAVIMLSGYNDRELVEGTIRLGAKGYIIKEDAPVYLIPAIRSICKDVQVWLSQRAAGTLFA